MKHTKSGFSLIELLVVIVIMGILATIAIGTFQGFFGQARDAKTKAEISSISKVVMAHFATDWDATTKYVVDSWTGAGTGVYLKDILEANGVNIDEAEAQDRCYLYGYLTSPDTSSDAEYFVMAKDVDAGFIIEGTPGGKTAAATIADPCTPTTLTRYTLVDITVPNE